MLRRWLQKVWISRPGGRSILYPGAYLGWLGINEHDFRREMRSRGYRAYSFADRVFDDEESASAPTQAESASRECSHAIDDALVYIAAVAEERTPAELSGPDAVDGAFRNRWFHRLRKDWDRLEELFHRRSPAGVVLIQGYEPLNLMVRHHAVVNGLPLVAIENTALRDRLLWENVSGITTNRSLAKNYFWRYQATINSSEARDYCSDLIASTKARKLSEHDSPEGLPDGLGGKPTILILGQVYTDSSIVFGLRGWSSPVEMICETLAYAEAKGYAVVVKLHPKEVAGLAPVVNRGYEKLTWRRLQESPEFRELAGRMSDVVVDHDNLYDTYALMEHAKVVVTVNSQAGLEASIRGVPAILCGDAFYGGLGFTWEAFERSDLAKCIESAMTTSSASRRKAEELASLFTYIYFEKYCIKKNVADLASRIAASLAKG